MFETASAHHRKGIQHQSKRPRGWRYQPTVEQLEERSLLATHLLVEGFPTPVTAGVEESFAVSAENADNTIDATYAGTIHFTSSDNKAVLPADYTFKAGDAGTHTFAATLKTVAPGIMGTQSIMATDTATGSIAGSQEGITVNPAAAKSLMLYGGLGLPVTAGAPTTEGVVAQDAFGNTATGYSGTIHFTSSDPKALLPADFTFTPAAAGQHFFDITLSSAGTQSVSTADTTDPSITGSADAMVTGANAPAATPNAAFLQQVYLDLLGRAIDSSGMAGWGQVLDQGVSRSVVVLEIETCSTQEYQTRMVNLAYELLLRRPVDPSGLQTGLNVLGSFGLGAEYAFIAGSQEYQQQRSGGAPSGWLSAIYQDAFHRAIDPSGQASFTEELSAGSITYQQAAAIIFTSPEYQMDLVENDYKVVLRRPADSAGLIHWIGLLAAGASPEQILAGILGSPEYFDLAQQTL
jgi:Domain of unknown function (DUF4214)